ncbi:MAG TPA: adenylate/guanylate cyclase domain-containing protein, partial [Hanamia sp.]|nr:adenylate/guanylate cyclase domain-containing protein [Hanamia sp.]
MASTRQLAAIMFTDIVGYTALMGDNEQRAFELLRKNRELQKPIIEKYSGHWIKELGDGVLASFNTVSDAVNAAVEIQQATNKAKDFLIRVGIHLGEVVFENDDVFGDGVNIASRIQAIAQPGTIYISEPVYNNIVNKQGIAANFVKEEILKNVKGAIRIYEVTTHEPDADLDVNKNALEHFPGNCSCLVVLPFINMSSDPEQEYFSDGLTEELISNLTKLKEIRVISRTTSMKYKGTTKDIKTIGMETGASYIMEGSVRKQGNNLRITAQFIDANRDVHLWSENYHGMIDDIFDIQEKVSAKIVEALEIELTRGEKENIRKRQTDNTEAYQLYLQGRYSWNKRNEEGIQTSIRYFKKAIEKDPEYALAWAGLADAYNLLGEFSNWSRRELYPKARSAVDMALK